MHMRILLHSSYTWTLRETTTHSVIPRLFDMDPPMKLYVCTPQVAVRGRPEAYLKPAAPGQGRLHTKLRQRARKFDIRVFGTGIMPDTVDDVGPQR